MDYPVSMRGRDEETGEFLGPSRSEQRREALDIRSLALEELPSAEAAFLTGTSPKVLPIRKAGNASFIPFHQLVSSLAEGYDKLIINYLSQHR